MKNAALAASAVLALAALGWRASHRAPSAPVAQDPAAAAKLEELRDILRSKNDNDPRLDADFNALTPEAKRLFRAEYASLPLTRRNERGTIVFLLGRNRLDADDWTFLRDVVGEPPCLSLADCAKNPSTADDEARGDEVTLAYPQLIALKLTEMRLADKDSAAPIRGVLDAARRSSSRAVQRTAERLSRRLQ